MRPTVCKRARVSARMAHVPPLSEGQQHPQRTWALGIFGQSKGDGKCLVIWEDMTAVVESARALKVEEPYDGRPSQLVPPLMQVVHVSQPQFAYIPVLSAAAQGLPEVKMRGRGRPGHHTGPRVRHTTNRRRRRRQHSLPRAATRLSLRARPPRKSASWSPLMLQRALEGR